ncbi:hypothetical protein WMF27_20600 [Sorangium sp. So ce281]|uniref:hypothetical protein n=1 Tax=unclassified Sorangium TaxID=2621164 RepID=UPI003F5F81B2
MYYPTGTSNLTDSHGKQQVMPAVAADRSLRVTVQQPTASPKPARIARVVHLASATLPASGAWTNQAAYAIPDGVSAVSFITTYTRGVANGQPKFRILVGNGTEEGDISVIDPMVTASQPFGLQSAYAQVVLGTVPQDGNPVSRELTVLVRGGWTSIRMIAAEHGVTATPGTLAIALTAAY